MDGPEWPSLIELSRTRSPHTGHLVRSGFQHDRCNPTRINESGRLVPGSPVRVVASEANVATSRCRHSNGLATRRRRRRVARSRRDHFQADAPPKPRGGSGLSTTYSEITPRWFEASHFSSHETVRLTPLN